MRSTAVVVAVIGAIALAVSTSPVPSAQEQQSASATQAPTVLPETPPPGWDPAMWSRFRQSCKHIGEKSRAGIALSRGEFAGSEECESMFLNLYPPPPAANSYPAPAAAVPPHLVP